MQVCHTARSKTPIHDQKIEISINVMPVKSAGTNETLAAYIIFSLLPWQQEASKNCLM